MFPLATPLVAGPAALAAIVLYAGEHDSIPGLVALNLILIAIMALCLLILLAAGSVTRLLGQTGITVVTRVLGILLAALSVQLVLDGLAEVGIIGSA